MDLQKRDQATISRRTFLRQSAVVGAVALTAPLVDLGARALAAPHQGTAASPPEPLTNPDAGVSFQVPSDWEAWYKWGYVFVTPKAMDQGAVDRAYLVVHDYSLARERLGGRGYVLEDCVHRHSNGARSWVRNLRNQLGMVDPGRRFEIVADDEGGGVIDSPSGTDLRRTAYVSRQGRALGAVLVGFGRYASKEVAAKEGLLKALDEVATSLDVARQPAPASRPSSGPLPSPEGIQSTRSDYWESSGGGTKAWRYVDWSYPTMTWNHHYCEALASDQYKNTLVRAIVTDQTGTCLPGSNYWSVEINQDFWNGHPADHSWSGSMSNSSIGSQTIFFTLITFPGIWYCLDHWHAFS